MQHFLSTVDWTEPQLDGLLELATELKRNPIQDTLRGKSIALMFLNPSLRTRRTPATLPAGVLRCPVGVP